ncbi:MAG: S41 family peptidase, partial [Oscillospiraceae bacterium]
ISLVAIGCAITFVLTWTVSLNIYNSKISSSEKYEGVYAKLREMDVTVRNNYIGELNDDALEQSIINGYVLGIGDKYASYMGASSYYELQQTTSGIISGAGIETEDDGSGYLRITTVYKGGSAELGGVLAGDVITEIDGKSLLSMDGATAADKLSGEVGTRVALKLLRDGEEISVNLIRQQLEIESVTGEMLGENIGYISITAFNSKTPEQFADVLTKLTDDGAKALILDVRQNGGGLVSALKPILSRFIPTATIASAEYADGSRKPLVETDSDSCLAIPMAVLVDGGTASAAELFAVALRDECGAVLVGTQTYGKAVIQNTYEFSDGSAVTISTAKIIPAKSDSYNGVGLKPDYMTELSAGVLPENLAHDADAQLQKAIEVLTPTAAAAE